MRGVVCADACWLWLSKASGSDVILTSETAGPALEDGVVLHELAQRLTGSELDEVRRPAVRRVDRMRNARIALRALEALGVFFTVSPSDIVSGDVEAMLSLLWQCMRYLQKKRKPDFLKVVQARVKEDPYQLSLHNFSADMVDGMVLLAVVHSIDASVVDWTMVESMSRNERLKLAFGTAVKLGATPWLGINDMDGVVNEVLVMFFLSDLLALSKGTTDQEAEDGGRDTVSHACQRDSSNAGDRDTDSNGTVANGVPDDGESSPREVATQPEKRAGNSFVVQEASMRELRSQLAQLSATMDDMSQRQVELCRNVDGLQVKLPLLLQSPTYDTGSKVALLAVRIHDRQAVWAQLPNTAGSMCCAQGDLFRRLVALHSGYEVVRTETDYQAVFPSVADASVCALQLQLQSMDLPWPPTWHDVPCTKKQLPLWIGWRLAVGIHVGQPVIRVVEDGATCTGECMNEVTALCRYAHGGQILLSRHAWTTLGLDAAAAIAELPIGTVVTELPTKHVPGLSAVDGVSDVVQILPSTLSKRMFDKVPDTALGSDAERIGAFRAELDATTVKLKHMRANVETSGAEVDSMFQQLREAKISHAVDHDDLADLGRELAHVARVHDELVKELQGVQVQVASFSGLVGEPVALAKAGDDDVVEPCSECDLLSAEVASLKQSLCTKEQALAQERASRADLEGELRALRQELAACKARFVEVRVEPEQRVPPKPVEPEQHRVPPKRVEPVPDKAKRAKEEIVVSTKHKLKKRTRTRRKRAPGKERTRLSALHTQLGGSRKGSPSSTAPALRRPKDGDQRCSSRLLRQLRRDAASFGRPKVATQIEELAMELVDSAMYADAAPNMLDLHAAAEEVSMHVTRFGEACASLSKAMDDDTELANVSTVRNDLVSAVEMLTEVFPDH